MQSIVIVNVLRALSIWTFVSTESHGLDVVISNHALLANLSP